MILAHSLAEIQKDVNSVVTVGTFDGVHLAHQEIIREVVNRARMKEGRSVAITFEPHPREIVGRRGETVRLLTTLDERIALIRNLNVDVLLIINFTHEFSRISAREFYERFVVEDIGASEVVVGYDHMFGRGRTAGIEKLVQMGKEYNFSVFAVHPYRVAGEVLSSSLIRETIDAGNVEKAASLLGYRFKIEGKIVTGDGRGKTIGYPTANIRPLADRKILPGRGVYLVGVAIDVQEFYGMMNIGVRPTVKSEHQLSIEVHVFGLAKDIYGETVAVTFLRKLRNEQKFSSLEELSAQLGKDKETSMRYIAEFDRKR